MRHHHNIGAPNPIGRRSDKGLDRLRRYVRRLAAQIGGLAYSGFDPGQRSMIFIYAVEVDHGLTSHLVSPDPLVGDQLISLGFSEFAIAATVLELDEAPPPVVIIVNHGSCMCFDDLRDNRIWPH